MIKYEELLKAKENVKWLLDNPNGLIDMKGLSYWAGVVERLREEENENVAGKPNALNRLYESLPDRDKLRL